MKFFEELKKLKESQPHLCVHVWKSENSDYCDQIDGCKNCYLCFNNRLTEDCMYCFDSRWNKDCVDVSYCNKCELCYDSIDLEGCYGCRGCQDCENCEGCAECYDCKACKDCFGCVGLRRKRFCVYNEEFSEADYKVRMKKIREGSSAGAGGVADGVAGGVAGDGAGGVAGDGAGGVADGVAGGGAGDSVRDVSEFQKLKKEYPHISLYSLNAENCFGNYIVGSKNSYYVFKVHSLEDCFYMYDSQEDKDCMDCCAFNKSELCYGCMENSMLYNCNFMYWCANCVDCSYMMYSFDCENCFGCFGLKHKKFCVLNEQCASKEEYLARVASIKKAMIADGVWGEGLESVF